MSDGRIAGSTQGRQDKIQFVPDIYTQSQNTWVDDFFKQNGYIGKSDNNDDNNDDGVTVNGGNVDNCGDDYIHANCDSGGGNDDSNCGGGDWWFDNDDYDGGGEFDISVFILKYTNNNIRPVIDPSQCNDDFDWDG